MITSSGPQSSEIVASILVLAVLFVLIKMNRVGATGSWTSHLKQEAEEGHFRLFTLAMVFGMRILGRGGSVKILELVVEQPNFPRVPVTHNPSALLVIILAVVLLRPPVI